MVDADQPHTDSVSNHQIRLKINVHQKNINQTAGQRSLLHAGMTKIRKETDEQRNP